MAIEQQMMSGMQPEAETEDAPIGIGEMDFAFLTKNDPATEPQDAALRMKQNLDPQEQKEIAGLVPYVERFFVLNYKAETGDYPPDGDIEPEGGGGVTIDEYRSMSDEDRVANSMSEDLKPTLKPRSIHDKSPSMLPQAMPVEAPAMEQPIPQQPVEQSQEMQMAQQAPTGQPEMMQEGGAPKTAKVETNKAMPKDKEAVPAGPVGEINVAGKDKSGVADDIQTKSDGFILSKGAVIANGKMYIRDIIQEAIDNLNKKGIRVDIDKIPEKAEDILISNGEIVIPDIIAQEIGYKRLEKMNNRGKELTEKLIAQHEQQQGQQQQAQLVPAFQEGDAVNEDAYDPDVVSQLEQTPGVGIDYTEDQFMQMQGVNSENQMKNVPEGPPPVQTVQKQAVQETVQKPVVQEPIVEQKQVDDFGGVDKAIQENKDRENLTKEIDQLQLDEYQEKKTEDKDINTQLDGALNKEEVSEDADNVKLNLEQWAAKQFDTDPNYNKQYDTNNFYGGRVDEDLLYSAISQHEWAGKTPKYDFVGIGDGVARSSAFGPAQIVGETVVEAMKDMDKNSEVYKFSNRLQAAQKLFINLADKHKNNKPFNAKNAKSAANTTNARNGKWLETLGITKEQFGKYVEQGYFIPSNKRTQKGLASKGIPPEILGDNYKENYRELFNTVVRQKFRRDKSSSLGNLLISYHGADETVEDKAKKKKNIEANKNYAESVLKILYNKLATGNI